MAFTVLKSTTNFFAWSRDLQVIAMYKGLWPYLKGTKELRKEPVRCSFTTATDEEYNQFRSAVEEYNKQQTDIAAAFELLHFSVSPSIRRLVIEYATPAEAYSAIQKRYQANEYRLRGQAYTRMEFIELNRGKTMSQFIEELKSCQHDIVDAKGSYSDEQLIRKIARSLPKEYDNFVQDNIKFADETPKLDEITDKLLTLEHHILKRQQSNDFV